MADNTQLNVGTGGDLIASDDIGGVKHQRVKVEFGADGSATDVSTTNPMPVRQVDNVLFKGIAATPMSPGRANTSGQRLISIWNAVGSGRTVTVHCVTVDVRPTAVKAITIKAPLMRLYKNYSIYTGGEAGIKTKIGGSTTSSADITVRNDASSDNVLGTALGGTFWTGDQVGQHFAPRILTAVGEVGVSSFNLADAPIEVYEGEGLTVALVYTLATENPVTDIWVATLEWTEH